MFTSSTTSARSARLWRYATYWLGCLIIFSQLYYFKLLHDTQPPPPLPSSSSTVLDKPSHHTNQPLPPPSLSASLHLPFTEGNVAHPTHPSSPPSSFSSPSSSSFPFVNHVFVYQKRWREAVAEAKAGGPAGELFLYDTAERALRYLAERHPELHLEVHKLQNREELDVALADLQRIRDAAPSSSSSQSSSSYSSSPTHRLIGLYTQTFDLIEDGGVVFSHALLDVCTYRWLDFWGTPPEQNSIHHHLLQFLTPYDYHYNQHLGLIVDPPPPPSPPSPPPPPPSNSTATVYEPRLCLWGKLARYFPDDRWAALQFVLDHLPTTITRPTVHATVAPPVPNAPSFLINHGVQSSSSAFHSYLSSCTLLLGMGDPILGPTVFQAIAHGVVYVNYQYTGPKKFWMNGRMNVHTQHDEADRMMNEAGAGQWVRNVRWEGQGGMERLTEVVADELTKAEMRWKEFEAGGRKGEWKEGFILPAHRLDNVAERVRLNLFNSDICPWIADPH